MDIPHLSGSPNSDTDNPINTPKIIGQKNNQNETASQPKESDLPTKTQPERA